MRSVAGFVVVLAALWVGSGGRALAEKTPPGATKVSADSRTRLQTIKLDQTRRIAVEQRMGVRVTKLRKGELLAPAAVPELDPNAAGLALLLLAGGAMLVVDRRRLQA